MFVPRADFVVWHHVGLLLKREMLPQSVYAKVRVNRTKHPGPVDEI